ncbi:hypothetical protein NX059_008520 [Plenodomus lindquistii]|nr:hypothetical protein NX059_008520 [Plenodomus lindquistii]
MDRQPAPPPDRFTPTTQPYSSFTPSTTQTQPLHVPLAADAFFPAAAQHIRRTSQGVPGGNNAPQGHGEGRGQGGWAHTGTDLAFFSLASAFWQTQREATGPASDGGYAATSGCRHCVACCAPPA